jgi:cysteine desulfurase
MLWVRRGVRVEPLVHGGGQQGGRRSGTEDVAGAVGLAAALRLTRSAGTSAAEVAARRDRFVAAGLESVPGAALTGHPVRRLPGHASFVLPGRSGESVLLDLERRGVVCSSGSACHAGSDEPSHVLVAMGVPSEVAQTAVRFTFGRSVTDEQLTDAARALADVCGR